MYVYQLLHACDVPRWYASYQLFMYQLFMYVTCLVDTCVISTLPLCHVKSLFMYVTCLVHTCGLTCSYVWHIRDLFIRVIHDFSRLCDVVSWHVPCALFIYVTATHCNTLQHTATHCAMWLVHLRDMTCSYVCHDLGSTCWHGTLLVHARDITPWYVWHGLWYAADDMLRSEPYILRSATCLVHTCHMYEPFSCMSHDLFIRVTLTCLYMTHHLCRHVPWFVQLCHVIRLYVWHNFCHDSCTCLVHLWHAWCTTRSTCGRWTRHVHESCQVHNKVQVDTLYASAHVICSLSNPRLDKWDILWERD